MACTICSGSKEEHFEADGKRKTIHEYTEKQGDLHAAQEKPAQIAPPAMRLQMAGASIEVSRLVEVLMDKGLLTIPEVLYIAGVGQKPSPPSGYRDPSLSSGIMPCTTGGN